MRILLVSSTKFEVEPLLKKLKQVSVNGNLSNYRFGSHSADVLITGVGMTAMAFHLGRIASKKYDLAINAGTAGSFRKDIPPGMIVNVVNDCFADLGAEDGGKFLTLKEMGIGKQVSTYRWQITNPKIKEAIKPLRRVHAITVNTVHGNKASIKKVMQRFNPDVESMEGAAFFFACNQQKIPCIQIRSISNYVERRDRKKWKMNLAVKNLSRFLESLADTASVIR